MENFLALKNLWNFSQIDLILVQNSSSKVKKIIFTVILLHFSFYCLIFMKIAFRFPTNFEDLSEGLVLSSAAFLLLLQTLTLYFKKEKLYGILSKIPEKFKDSEIEKFKLKSLIFRTRLIFSLVGLWGQMAVTLVVIKNLIDGEFPEKYNFPLLSNRPVFLLLNLNAFVTMTFFSIYLITMQILKFGLISVTAIEFSKLREDFRKLEEKVSFMTF